MPIFGLMAEEIINLKNSPGIHKSLAKCDKIYILVILNHSEKYSE